MSKQQEVASWRCYVKKAFVENFQNSQEMLPLNNIDYLSSKLSYM